MNRMSENSNSIDDDDNKILDSAIMNNLSTTTVTKFIPDNDEKDQRKMEDPLLPDNSNDGDNDTDMNDAPDNNNDNQLVNFVSDTEVNPADLLLDGETFEQIMKERSRIRREKEEYHIGELRVKINKLEQALMAETKRRIDAIKKIKGDMQSEIESVQNKILKQMDDETQVVNGRLDVLENRIDSLEKRWKNDCYQLQEVDIQKKSSQIQQLLAELRVSVETERKSRLIREGRLLQSMEENSSMFQDKFATQEKARSTAIKELSTSIEQHQKARLLQQQNFEQRLYDELQALQRELQLECQERKLQDQAIVSALNRYTQQFQHSLSILTED